MAGKQVRRLGVLPSGAVTRQVEDVMEPALRVPKLLVLAGLNYALSPTV
jgi:hypothetical protein